MSWALAAHMCRSSVRPVCKMLGLVIGDSMPNSTMVPLLWMETAGLRRIEGT